MAANIDLDLTDICLGIYVNLESVNFIILICTLDYWVRHSFKRNFVLEQSKIELPCTKLKIWNIHGQMNGLNKHSIRIKSNVSLSFLQKVRKLDNNKKMFLKALLIAFTMINSVAGALARNEYHHLARIRSTIQEMKNNSGHSRTQLDFSKLNHKSFDKLFKVESRKQYSRRNRYRNHFKNS